MKPCSLPRIKKLRDCGRNDDVLDQDQPDDEAEEALADVDCRDVTTDVTHACDDE